MGFVTVNSPPSTADGFVTSSHLTGGVRLGVDCSVNPFAAESESDQCLSRFGSVSLALIIGNNTIGNLDHTGRSRRPLEAISSDDDVAVPTPQGETMRPRISRSQGVQPRQPVG